MAKKLPVIESSNPEPTKTRGELIRVDFRPELTRKEIMLRIGEAAALGWHPELGSEILSSEPIHASEHEEGIDVTFKLYERHAAFDDHGIATPDGWSGPETIRVLKIGWNVASKSISSDYIHARNFRYQLLDLETKKRTEGGRAELQALHSELW